MDIITLIKLTYIQVIASHDVTCDVTFDGTWIATLKGPHDSGFRVVSSSEDVDGRSRATVFLGVQVLNVALEIKHPSHMLKALIRDLMTSVLRIADLHNIRLGALEAYKAQQRKTPTAQPLLDWYA